MANHLHAILNIKKMNVRRGPPHREGFSSPTFASVPTIVRTFKAAVTRHFRQHPSVGVIWLLYYFEHVIRDGKEYAEICRYIRENPLRWDLDENHPSSVAKQKPRLCRGGTIYRAPTGS